MVKTTTFTLHNLIPQSWVTHKKETHARNPSQYEFSDGEEENIDETLPINFNEYKGNYFLGKDTLGFLRKTYLGNGELVQSWFLPNHTKQRCHNCHHTFNTRPLSCPIKYHEIDPNSKEGIKLIEEFNKKNIPIVGKDGKIRFFECKYLFCGRRCVKKFILEKRKSNILYEQSLTMLSLIDMLLFETTDVIPPASDIEMLKVYGGPWDIEKYREDTVVYTTSNNYIEPLFFPVGDMLETDIALTRKEILKNI